MERGIVYYLPDSVVDPSEMDPGLFLEWQGWERLVDVTRDVQFLTEQGKRSVYLDSQGKLAVPNVKKGLQKG